MKPPDVIDVSLTFGENARRVISQRAGDVYGLIPSLENPADGEALHQLRIAVKRLRYSLEFFEVCFDASEVEWLLESLSQMQDVLGDLHDSDVHIHELREVLGQVAEENALSLKEEIEGSPQDGEEFHKAVAEVVSDAPHSPYEAGLVGLLIRSHEARERAYKGSVELWERLESEGIRERLRRLVEQPATQSAPPQESYRAEVW